MNALRLTESVCRDTFRFIKITKIDTVQCKEPMLIDKDGFSKVPDKPGIGIELDEEKLSENLIVT